MTFNTEQIVQWCSLLVLVLAGCSRTGVGVPTSETSAEPTMDGGSVDDAGFVGDAGSSFDAASFDAGEPPELPGFVQVALGREHSCGLSDDAEVWCWGSDLYGQLGQGLQHRHECGTSRWKSPCRAWAEPVPDLRGALAIAADRQRTCALMEDGEVRCHGASPISPAGLPRVVQISMGRHGLYGVDEEGAVWRSRFWSVAERIGGVESVTQVAAGDAHACALHDDGTVTCWGSNYNGQLGVPHTAACSYDCGPVSVTLPGPAVEITVGEAQSCARLADTRIVCWGYVGTREEIAPEPVPELDGSTAVTAGSAGVVCGHAADDELRCIAPPSLRFDPASLGPASRLALSHDWHYGDRVREPDGWVDSTGDRPLQRGRTPHACAVRVDGSIACTGADYAGQLGRGRWDAVVHAAEPIRSARAVDVPPPPPPGRGVDPRWQRMRAMPRHCPLEVARDPARVVTLNWERCAFGPPSCRALVAPGFTIAGGWHDGERGYVSMRSNRSAPVREGERQLTAIATTELQVLAAWAGPTVDFWCDEEPAAPRCAPRVNNLYSCRVARVVFGDDHVAVSMWVSPWPARVVHAPIAEAASLRQPSFLSLPISGEAVSRSIVAFKNPALPLTDDGRTILSAPRFGRHPNARRSLVVFGRDLLWLEGPDPSDPSRPSGVMVAGYDRPAAANLITRSDVVRFGSDGRDLVWVESTGRAGAPLEIWTSPHGVRSSEIVPRRLGTITSPYSTFMSRPLAVGAGRVAWLERGEDRAADVIVLDIADGTRRRFDVPYHLDAAHSQLVPPMLLTATELYVPTASVTHRGVMQGNRLYRVRIQDLPVDTPGP